jgi:hypothetical protein
MLLHGQGDTQWTAAANLCTFCSDGSAQTVSKYALIVRGFCLHAGCLMMTLLNKLRSYWPASVSKMPDRCLAREASYKQHMCWCTLWARWEKQLRQTYVSRDHVLLFPAVSDIKLGADLPAYNHQLTSGQQVTIGDSGV